MSRKAKIILGIIFLSIALLVCLYPVISNFTAVKYQSIVQTRYEKAVSNMDDETLKEAKEAALAYNRTLIPGVLLLSNYPFCAKDKALSDTKVPKKA